MAGNVKELEKSLVHAESDRQSFKEPIMELMGDLFGEDAPYAEPLKEAVLDPYTVLVLEIKAVRNS